MITATCPRCTEVYRLPSLDLPPDASAQCPWCGEIYPASEILSQLPPMVQLISVDGRPLFLDSPLQASPGHKRIDNDSESIVDSVSDEEATIGEDGESDLNETWSFDEEKTVDDLSSFAPDSVDSTDFETSDVHADDSASHGSEEPGLETIEADDASFEMENPDETDDQWNMQLADTSLGSLGTVAAMKVKTQPSPQRKKHSIWKTVRGPILGFLLAIPLAGLILLPFGRAPNLGFWPFDGSFDRGLVSPSRTASPQSKNESSSAERGDRPKASGDDESGPGRAMQSVPNSLAKYENDSAVAAETDTEPAELVLPGAYLQSDGDSALDSLSPGEVAYPSTAADDPPREALPASDAAPDAEVAHQGLAMTLPEMTLPEMTLPDVTLPDVTLPSLGMQTTELEASEDAGLKQEANTLREPGAELPQSLPQPPSMATDASEIETPGENGASDEGEEDVVDAPSTPASTSPTPPLPAPPSPVDTAVGKANRLLAQLMKSKSTGVPPDRLFADSYAAVAAVAASPNAQSDEKVAKLINNIGRSPLVQDIGDAANQWLDFPERTSDGAVLVGRPESNVEGKVLMINVPNGNERKVMVSGMELPAAEKVLAFGKIIDDASGQRVELIAVEPLE
ncbi:hypothetical protein [Novipirellula artificiosorum]|uniref:Uncharacterized protein n=1 Tax=Novipirellula artificiosorum TaxID=2528016 RepID=A0A5C6D6P9_9BACT|nr:hypothetical protein [Novipirellula artificiosorum]TWU32863.1 hypothetical protein Poly41_52400 [Novipirellula artificiosorum]